MTADTIEITLSIACRAVPPRCRNPREYRINRKFTFPIQRLDTLPEPALLVQGDLCSKKKTPYYFIEEKLYVKDPQGNQSLLNHLTNKKGKDTLPDDAFVLDTETIEEATEVASLLSRHIFVKDGTLLEETTEPAYQVHRSFNYDYVGVENHPAWGEPYIYRADQWKEAKAQSHSEKRTKPPIEILNPEAIRGIRNPEEPSFDPKGESSLSITEKLSEQIAFHAAFSLQNQKSHRPDPLAKITPPVWTDGLWKPILANANTEEVRLLLVECDPKNGEILPNGRFQCILRLEERYSFDQNWKQKIRHLNDFCKKASPKKSEEEWEVWARKHENPAPPDKKDELRKTALQIIKRAEDRNTLQKERPEEPLNAQEEMELPLFH